MVEFLLFICTTTGLIYVSRASLRKPGSHGFYRFFAWECLLALLLLNLRRWFALPFSFHQVISWLLLVISAITVVGGFIRLNRHGKPGETRADEPLLELEKTTVLVEDGIYRYIRHPLYLSLLLLGWGIFFKQLSWPGFLLGMGASFFLWLTALVEEKENIRYFGEAYLEYMKKTRMFIPFIW
jgi:protein-S-isoprenylcysteine O-methyltransferase Ste14